MEADRNFITCIYEFSGMATRDSHKNYIQANLLMMYISLYISLVKPLYSYRNFTQ